MMEVCCRQKKAPLGGFVVLVCVLLWSSVSASPVDSNAGQVAATTNHPWALALNVTANTLYSCPTGTSSTSPSAFIWNYTIDFSTTNVPLPSTKKYGSSATLWQTAYALIQQGHAASATGSLYLIVQPSPEAIAIVGSGSTTSQFPQYSISVCDVEPAPSGTTALSTTLPITEIYSKCGALSRSPTAAPTLLPTREPSAAPTYVPSAAPTYAPTTNPTPLTTSTITTSTYTGVITSTTLTTATSVTSTQTPTAQPTVTTYYGPMTSLECSQKMPWAQIGSDLDVELVGDTPVSGQYGYSVALSSDGNTVAVGIPATDGGARIYSYSGGSWSQLGSDILGTPSSFMGASIAISADGLNVFIGVPFAGSGAGLMTHHVYSGGSWSKVGSDITGDTLSDNLGTSVVTVTSENSIVAVASRSGNSGTGYVKVLNCIDGITCSSYGNTLNGANSGDVFGSAISLSSDGDRIAIGVSGYDGVASDSGLVQVYEISANDDDAGTLVWSQLGNDIPGSFINEKFGDAVALIGNGTIVAVGAYDGYVYVYELVGSTWTQLGLTINLPSGSIGRPSVAWSADGSVLGVGKDTIYGQNNGEVGVYAWTGTEWRINGVTVVGATSTTKSGYDISFSSDGLTLAIGAVQNSDDTAAGLARVYRQNADDNSGWAVRYADDALSIVVRRYCCATYAQCDYNFLYETGIDACACPSLPTEGQVNNNNEPCVYCIQSGAITMMYCSGNSPGCSSAWQCPTNHAIMNDACVPAYTLPTMSPSKAPTYSPTTQPTFRITVPDDPCWTFVLDNGGTAVSPTCHDLAPNPGITPSSLVPTQDESVWCKRRPDNTVTFWEVSQVYIRPAGTETYGDDTDITVQRTATAADFTALETANAADAALLSTTIVRYIDLAVDTAMAGSCWCTDPSYTRRWLPYGIVQTIEGTHPSAGGTDIIPLLSNDADIIPRDFYAVPGPQSSVGVSPLPFSTLLTTTIVNPGTTTNGATPASLASIETIGDGTIDVWLASIIGDYPLMPDAATCDRFTGCTYAASNVSLVPNVVSCRFVCAAILFTPVGQNKALPLSEGGSIGRMPSDIVMLPSVKNATACTGANMMWINQRALTSLVHGYEFKRTANILGVANAASDSPAYFHYIPWINLTRNTERGDVDESSCVYFAQRYCSTKNDWFGYKSDLYCHYSTLFGGTSSSAFDILITKGRYGGIGGWTPSGGTSFSCSTYANGSAVLTASRYNNQLYGAPTNDAALRLNVPRISSISAYTESVPSGALGTSISLSAITWTDDALIRLRVGLGDLFWRNVAAHSQGTVASGLSSGINASIEAVAAACDGGIPSYKIYVDSTTFLSVTIPTTMISDFPTAGETGCAGMSGCELLTTNVDTEDGGLCTSTPGCAFVVATGGTTFSSTTTGTTPGGFGTLPRGHTDFPSIQPEGENIMADGERSTAAAIVTIILVAIVFAAVVRIVLARRPHLERLHQETNPSGGGLAVVQQVTRTNESGGRREEVGGGWRQRFINPQAIWGGDDEHPVYNRPPSLI